MADTRTLKLSLLADVQKFLNGMDKAEKGTKNFSDGVGKYSKAMAASFAAAGVAAGAMAIKIGIDSVKAASDLNEELSKTEIIFGDTAKEIKAFAQTADKSLGLSQKEAMGAASTFAVLGKNAGLTGKDLSKFSKTSVTLASDLASFYNTRAEDAIAAIGSAMRGEAEPIRKYGVLISAAALDQAALNYENRTGETLERDKKNQLTETSKVLARYQAILDQTGDAQGDFNRTSEGLAAQQKILNAQLENLKTTMGQSLLPVMKDVVTQANYVAAALAGKDPESLSERARELAGTYDGQGAGAYNLGLAMRNAAKSFSQLFAVLNGSESADGATALQNLADGINSIATGLENLSKAGKGFSDFKKTGAGQFLFGQWGPGGMFPGLLNPSKPKSNAAGGPVMGNQVTRVGEFGPELFVPAGMSGSIRKDNGGGGVTINLNGIVDAESARRSIERLMQNSTRRTGALDFAGSQL